MPQNACEQVTIGFGLNSDWLRKWREIFNQSPSVESRVVKKNQSKLLEYFQELVNMYDGDQRRKFVWWNNREIKNKGKILFWKTGVVKGIYLV